MGNKSVDLRKQQKVSVDFTSVNDRLDDIFNELVGINNNVLSVIDGLGDINTELLDMGVTLDNIDARIVILNSKIDTVNTRLTSIDNQLTSVNSELDNITAQLVSANAKLTTINSGINTTNSKLDDVNLELDTISSHLIDIENFISAIYDNSETIKTRIINIDTHINVNLSTRLSESDFDTKTGSLTETAPASDTASSGLNGRLQRIAQRLTSLIALLPTALVGGGFNIRPLTASDIVTVQGTINTLGQSSTASHTTPSITASSAIALAANSNRKGATIFNDSASIVYLKFGATVSTASFSVRIGVNDYYELPQPVYTGALHMIRGAGSAIIQITEFT